MLLIQERKLPTVLMAQTYVVDILKIYDYFVVGVGGGGLKMIFDKFIAFGTLKVSVFVSNTHTIMCMNFQRNFQCLLPMHGRNF